MLRKILPNSELHWQPLAVISRLVVLGFAKDSTKVAGI